MISSISMASGELSWESIHRLMSGEILGVHPPHDEQRDPSLDHSIDKWKMQRRFLLQEVMCEQE